MAPAPAPEVDPLPTASESFEEWYGRTWKPLVSYLRVLGADAETADDLASEAMARAYCEFPTLDAPTAWVFVVARHLLRRQERRRALELRLLTTRFRHVEVSAELEPADDQLRAALNQLSRRQREAVALRYGADLTQAEVAEVLGVRPGTAAALLSQARARLKESLSGGRSTR